MLLCLLSGGFYARAVEARAAATFIYNAVLEEASPTPLLRLTVSIEVQAAPINAVEGTIGVPTGLRFKSVEMRDSIVDAWITEPAVHEPGLLRFAGVIPHGYSGTYGPYSQKPAAGLIFTVLFDVLDLQHAQLDIHAAEALLHDGFGTSADVQIQSNSAYAQVIVADQRTRTPQRLFSVSGFVIIVLAAAGYYLWRRRRNH